MPRCDSNPHSVDFRSNPYTNRSIGHGGNDVCQFRHEVPSAGLNPYLDSFLGSMPKPIGLWNRLDNGVCQVRCGSEGTRQWALLTWCISYNPPQFGGVRIDADPFASRAGKRKSLFARRSDRMRFGTNSSITG